MFARLSRLAVTLMLGLSVMACAHTTQTSGQALDAGRPPACDQFEKIKWYGGRKELTLAEIYNTLNFMTDESEAARLDWLRAVLGDTSETIRQVKRHNAALDALCGGSNELAEQGVPKPETVLHAPVG